jgi:hypothetical protein
MSKLTDEEALGYTGEAAEQYRSAAKLKLMIIELSGQIKDLKRSIKDAEDRARSLIRQAACRESDNEQPTLPMEG